MSRKYLVLIGIVLASVLVCTYIVIEHHEPLNSAVDYAVHVDTGKKVHLDVHVYTDKESYVIGDIVTFGIANDGNKTVMFSYGGPWEIHKEEKGEWIRIGMAEFGIDAEWRLRPGKKTGDPNVDEDESKWDTSGKHRHNKTDAAIRGNITLGRYRIVYSGIISDSGDSDDFQNWRQKRYLFIKEFALQNA
ncbi:MAG: hypothetical protein U9N41_06000 [Euryarchaeota archaeon]|nr:hypothetical protein [Euryarchaeota archaeon]